jgi:hypothetical protein
VLLVAVFGIWGTVAYKIWSGLNPELPEDIEMPVSSTFNPNATSEIDTFSIQILDRDPFLGTLTSKQSTTQKVTSVRKAEDVYIPIQYHGSIAKEDSKEIVYIVSIENTQYFMKSGQVLKDIKLLKGSKESIQVTYQGTTKTIAKL